MTERDGVYRLVGADGSPYSQKLRAVLRYKQLPFEWVPQIQLGGADKMWAQFPRLKVRVIPVLVRPDGTYGNDSTPLIRDVDAAHAPRRVLPEDPAACFLADVVEDLCDEWMTKVMFYGRFCSATDAKFGAAWQIRQAVLPKGAGAAGRAAQEKLAAGFAARQRGRMEFVGCEDGAVMVHSLKVCCEALEANADAGHPFLFGAAPTQADFALYGQMRQWINDPMPQRLVQEYPAAWGWVLRVEDLSGYDPSATAGGFLITPGAARLLAFARDAYLPFLVANAAALDAAAPGAKPRVAVPILGGAHTHRQPAFGYQRRCLRVLQRAHGALTPTERARVEAWVPAAALGAPPPAKL
eukprot:TRINITY_DN25034_c0_g1_i1.p1 TRINITY_DN25034_c0_g1~~TRINITY_DN25034_c0_g1_i1.p1  ORF type:complete len:376 (+),score=133.06 TRINITY_DN25034_c0_g1_i1:68-1129(+)